MATLHPVILVWRKALYSPDSAVSIETIKHNSSQTATSAIVN
jgi:hypothetical protein